MYMYTPGHSRVIGTGIYIPKQRVTSDEVMEAIGSTDRFGLRYKWLAKVTGVQERRVAKGGIFPSDMAVSAAREAFDRSGVLPREIDAIIYAGVIRDHMLEPGTAHIVQDKLGAYNAVVLDINNACLGFLSAIHLMDALIASGQVRRGLIVTGEQGYEYTRKACEQLKKTHDKGIFVKMAAGLTLGDAGAALVMGPKKNPESGFMGFMLHSEGQHSNLCYCGNDKKETPLFTDMAGIHREASRMVGQVYRELVGKRLKWQTSELDKFVTHQAGIGTLKVFSKATGIPLSIMPETVSSLGNIITATVPVILHRLIGSNKLAPDQKVLLSGTGGGISAIQTGVVWEDL